MILVGDRDVHFLRRVPLIAEDRREDRKEDDGQQERERLHDAVAPDVDPADAQQCADHSRSSRPVRAIKTSCSDAPARWRSVTCPPADCTARTASTTSTPRSRTWNRTAPCAASMTAPLGSADDNGPAVLSVSVR